MEEIWPKYQKEHKKAQTSQGMPPADKGGPTRPYGPISSRIGAPHQRPAGPMPLLPSSTRVEARFSPTKAPSRARPIHTVRESGALPSVMPDIVGPHAAPSASHCSPRAQLSPTRSTPASLPRIAAYHVSGPLQSNE